MPPSSPKGICFDLDGTLLDTLDDLADSCNQVLKSVGLAAYPAGAYRDFIGEGVIRLFERALSDQELSPGTRDFEQLVGECATRFREEYGRAWNCKTRPFNGIVGMLREFERRSVKLSVLSNKPHAFTRKCVDHYFGEFSFEPVFGQREGVPRKPDPAAALEIAGHWQLPPGEIYYVGDSVIDMQTARAAGMTAVAVSWGYQPVDRLLEHGARMLIRHPHDLLGECLE